MKKAFSLMKALKVGLTSLAFAGSCLMASAGTEQHFTTRGTQIIDPWGNPITFNGTNLGNWLVWEGYMMMDDGNFRTHGQLFGDITKALGGDWQKAAQFETAWRDNYVTSQTIDELKSLGYNSVRVPFNYRLIWDIYNNRPYPDAFKYLDNLVNYCRNKGVYILLDMHGAPGFQNPGDHSDNSDSNKYQPINTVHFLDGTYHENMIGYNVSKTAEIWRYIADKYKNETVIWGYDLLNEPHTDQSARLAVAYQHIIKKIREVDYNHIVVVEGDYWGSYMKMFSDTPVYDSKLVLETHHYVFSDDQPDEAWKNIYQLYDRAEISKQRNVPIILGEFGEEKDNYLAEIRRVARDANYKGTFSWAFKKVSKDRTLWTIKPDDSVEGRALTDLRTAINSNILLSQVNGGRSTFDNLLKFANVAIKNGDNRLIKGETFYANTSTVINPWSASGLSGNYAIVTKASAMRGAAMVLVTQNNTTGNGGVIEQQGYIHGNASQKWVITPLGGDEYKIVGVTSNRGLDLRDGNTANNNTLQIWDVSSGPNQTWKIQYNSARGAYTIKSSKLNSAGSEIAIDVPNGSAASGQDMQIYTFYPGNINQEWELWKL